jgi:hypothetical protein
MTCEELNRAERAERSYPKPVRNNTPVWLAFFVGLAVGAGVFANWAFHPTHAVTVTAD